MQYDLEALTADFLDTLQNRVTPEEILRFYHPATEQVEYPNAITKTTAIRNLQDLKDASERGKKVLQKEEYEVLKSYTIGNTVIIEALWTGTLAIPLGSIPVGGKMTAHFAQFYEFQDGKIIRQRNYDCFDPF